MELSETQQKILNSAKRWFLEKGFKSAPLRKIVSDAGFTLGAFYGYYKNKEELFYALTDETAQGCLHCPLHRGRYAETSAGADALFHAGLLSAPSAGVGRLSMRPPGGNDVTALLRRGYEV